MSRKLTEFGCALACALMSSAAMAQPANPVPPGPAATPGQPAPAEPPVQPEPAPAAQPEAAQPAPATAPPAAAEPAHAAAQVAYLATSQRPGFAMLSSGNAVFGAIGGLAAVAASKKLAEEDDFTDPANDMRVDVAKAFAASKGLTAADAPIMLQPGDAKASFQAAKESAKAQGARYLVDLGTLSWMVIYFPLDWAHYGTTYGAAMRIIDLQSDEVVAKGRCFVKPEHTPDSPSKERLLADKGALLKRMAVEAAAKCGVILKTEVLKLPVSSAAASD
jgi:hypothetical protein